MDQARAWKQWDQWCVSIRTRDALLENLTRAQQIRLMGAFAMALCGKRLLGPRDDPLAEGTIQGAISYVASSFQDNNRPNPIKDEDGKLGRILLRLF
eukprot:11307737-Ditylum_brightwellii.AAC.1